MKHECLSLGSELRSKGQRTRGKSIGIDSLNTVLATSRYESRLWVGLMAYIPQKPAGIRTEPPFEISAELYVSELGQ